MTMTAYLETAAQLRDDILRGRFRSGERLKLAALARRYRTGQMPVREALRELQGERLVEMVPNCGARVRGVDATRVRNMFDVRIALESMVARRAAERIVPREVSALKGIETRFELCLKRQDYASALVTNREFHRFIGEIAGNREALEVLDGQWRLIPGLWKSVGYGSARFAHVISDHQLIIEALTARDPEAAAGITMSHAARAKNELLARLSAVTPEESS